MTIPGLALFYAGLVRAKNVVSMLMQVFAIVCMVAILWVIYGYSLAFTSGGSLNDYVGGLSKVVPHGRHAGIHGRDLLQRRGHPRVRLHLLPDDVRLHHPGADRRRVCRAHEILRPDAVHRAVGHVRLFPDRAHGLVLGRPRRACRCGQEGRRSGRRPRQGRGREGARRGAGRCRSCVPVGRHRLRRRHRGAHQLRHCRPRRRADARHAASATARSP